MIDPLANLIGGNGLPGMGQTRKNGESGFAETLKTFTQHVDGQLQEADRKTQEFAVGKRHDLHEIMITSEKANLSFRLLLQIRNKLLEAYQEISRMQF